MGKIAKVFGLGLVFCAIVDFAINFGLYHNVLINMLPSWFFNPFSLLTSRIVGNIFLVSGALGWFLNYIFAFGYSVVLFVVGAFALLK
jgi:hypothetical protein